MRDALLRLSQTLRHDLAKLVHRHNLRRIVVCHKGCSSVALTDQRQHIGFADPPTQTCSRFSVQANAVQCGNPHREWRGVAAVGGG